LIAIAKNCEKNGAAAIFIHGRTKEQLYSGEINYAAIKVVKQSVTIPVFGSGNIFSPEMAKKMIDQTGCDGITAARGALGHPWIFKEIEHYLKTGKLLPSVDLEEKKKVQRKRTKDEGQGFEAKGWRQS
jgi:tRNA-dihydrouridine synthase B